MDSTSLQWPPSPFMTAAMTRVFMFQSRSDWSCARRQPGGPAMLDSVHTQ